MGILRSLSAAPKLARRFFIDRSSWTYRDNLDALFIGSIDYSVLSYRQAPVTIEFPLKRFPTGWIFENVDERRAHLAL
jgi:hypothetical protein